MDLTFYFCDRKKCERCNSLCLHTSDPEHALSKDEWPFARDLWDNYVQVVNEYYSYETVEALNVSADNRTSENV